MASSVMDMDEVVVEEYQLGDIKKNKSKDDKGQEIVWYYVPVKYGTRKYSEVQFPPVTCYKRFENDVKSDFADSKSKGPKHSYLCSFDEKTHQFITNVEEHLITQLLQPAQLKELGFKSRGGVSVESNVRTIFKYLTYVAEERNGEVIPENERKATAFLPDKGWARFLSPSLQELSKPDVAKMFEKYTVQMAPTVAIPWIYVKTDKISVQWTLQQVVIIKLTQKTRKTEVTGMLKSTLMNSDMDEFNKAFADLDNDDFDQDEGSSQKVPHRPKEILKPKSNENVSKFLNGASKVKGSKDAKPTAEVPDDLDF